MKTAIVDTQITGHHLEYIYGIWSELIKRNKDKEIDIYCDSYLYEYVEENNLPDIGRTRLKIKADILEKLIGNWLKVTKTAFRNIQKVKDYDQITFLSVNKYLPALFLHALFFKPTFSFTGIFFDPHARKNNDPKNWIRNITLKYILRRYDDCKLFILNDNKAVNILNKRYSTDAFKVINDPIPEFYYNGFKYEKKEKGKLYTFTLIGSISTRKGVFQFLQAIKLSGSSSRFILAGKVDEKILHRVVKEVKALKEEGYDIELYNQFLTNRKFAKFVTETDILVMPYVTKGASSGILGHAAYMNKLVIGPEQGLISNLINDFNLGYTIDPENSKFFAELINTISLEQPDKIKHKGSIYAKENSLNQFCNQLLPQNKHD